MFEPNISFVEDTLDPTLNLDRGFTIMGWLSASNTQAWRTFVSIESPDADTSLFNVALPPGSMQIYFAYMVNSNTANRGFAVTNITAPGPNTEFHLAVSLTNSTHLDIYLNGVLQPFGNATLAAPIFNPPTKTVVLSKTKFQNVGGAQWDGLIHGVDIFNRTLTPYEIRSAMQYTSQI